MGHKSTVLKNDDILHSLGLTREDITITPTGHVFVKPNIREGLLPTILKELLDARKIAKRDMKAATDPMRRDVMNGRQVRRKEREKGRKERKKERKEERERERERESRRVRKTSDGREWEQWAGEDNEDERDALRFET